MSVAPIGVTGSVPATARPFRFTYGTGMQVANPRAVVEIAKRVEALGYFGLVLPDHIGFPASSLLALCAAAEATERIRLGTICLCNDLRHPAMTARDIATLDALSNGRSMVGIGAGHSEADYRSTGIRFDAASVRIARLEEALVIIKGLLEGGPFSFEGEHYVITDMQLAPLPVQQPRPPLIVGGGGPKILAVGARQADMVALSGGAPWGKATDARQELLGPAMRGKLARTLESAGSRAPQIDIILRLTAVVTDDIGAGAARCLEALNATFGIRPSLEIGEADILDSPCYVVGTVEQICDRLLEQRQALGVSHYTLYGTSPEAFAPVVAALSDR